MATMEDLQDQISELQARCDQLSASGPRYHTAKPIKPATYSSTRDSGTPATWLFSVDTYFKASGTPADRQVPLVATFLRGSASLWWQSVCRDVDAGSRVAITTPEAFRTEFLRVFSPVDGSKIARDALRQLTQAKSVSEYTDKFRSLVLQITNIGPAEALDRYVAGLKPHIRERVEIEDCKELDRAMFIAQRMDSIHHRSQQTLTRSTFAPTPQSTAAPTLSSAPPATSDGPTPMELGAMRPQGRTQQRPTFRKLTPADRSSYANEGRCFRCRQLGHWKGECPWNQSQPGRSQQSNQRRW